MNFDLKHVLLTYASTICRLWSCISSPCPSLAAI